MGALVTFRNQFIRIPEMAWYGAPSDDKVKIQRMIFPHGVYWNYPGFSNKRLGLPFSLIKEFQRSIDTQSEPSVPSSELFVSLIRAYKKLVELGLSYENGKVTALDLEEELRGA